MSFDLRSILQNAPPVSSGNLLPDYTISGDTTPIWNETIPQDGTSSIDDSQYGAPLTPPGGSVRIYTKAQVWAQDASRKRHGTYGIKCTSFKDATNIFGNTSSMGMAIIYNMGGPVGHRLVEGDEEWVAWSWYWPVGWVGTGVGSNWCNLFEFASGDVQHHPRNGSGFDAADPNYLYMTLHNGKTQNPAGHTQLPGLDYDGTYSAQEILLGGAGVPPFTLGVWHDFYMHIVYQAHTNGIFELWHREENGSFAKLYSNLNDGSAIINRAPHPTWYWNESFDVPGGTGLDGSSNDVAHVHAYRIYRSQGAFNTSHDLIYWVDGFRRRQSEAAILSEFPSDAGTSVSSSDSGTSSATSQQSALLVGSDSSTSLENVVASAVISSSDLGSDSENATIVSTLSSSESGTGSENASVISSLSSSDTGAGSEAASRQGFYASSELGTAVDSSSASALVTGADDGSGADNGGVLGGQVFAAGAEIGAGTDFASQMAKGDTDSGSSSETISGLTRLSSDSGAGIETASLVVNLSSVDSGVGVDLLTTIANGSFDFGVGSDTFTKIGKSVDDLGLGSENAIITSILFLTDQGAGVNVATVHALVQALENATSSESASSVTATLKNGTDSGTSVEHALSFEDISAFVKKLISARVETPKITSASLKSF